MQIDFKFASPQQQEFVLSKEKYTAYIGGLGSAKTHGGAMWMIKMILENPGARMLVAANTFYQLESATAQKVKDLLSEWGIKYTYNQKDRVLRILLPGFTGQVDFRTLHGKEYEQLAGVEFLCAWIDEAIGTTEQAFQRVRERCRQKVYRNGLRKGYPVEATKAEFIPKTELVENYIRITSTPSINEARWLYNFLRNADIRRSLEDAGLGIKEINAPSTANKFLPEDYVPNLLATLDSEQAKQQVYGEWIIIPDGKAVYGTSFREETHLKEMKFDKELPLIIGFDWGFHHPAAVFAQEDSENRLKVLGEYIGTDIERELFFEQVWYYINQNFLRKHNMIASDLTLECYCDPAGKQKTDASKKSTVQLARETGFKPLYPVRKLEVSEGVMTVRRRLNTLIGGIPSIMFDKYSCQYLVEGMKGGYHYQTVKDGTAEKTEPFKDGFYEHLQDAFRYICVGKYYRKSERRASVESNWKIVDEMTGY